MLRAILLILCLCSASVLVAQERVLSVEEMRGAAATALQTGQVALARDLAAALIERDPADHFGLVLYAQAQRLLDDPEAAREAAREAWRSAQTNEARYVAALTMAQVLSSNGQRTLAQVWLRRAYQVAPTDRHAGVAARDYQYVRSKNPWQVNFGFSIAPSSNINNGSRHETFSIGPFRNFPLAPERTALSGTEARSNLALRYRLADRGTAGQTDIYFFGTRSDYRLSDESKARAPNARAEDYAFATASTMLAHGGQINERLRFSVAGSVGKTWSGGDPVTTTRDVTGRLTWSPSDRQRLGGRLTVFGQTPVAANAIESNGWRASTSFETLLGATPHRLTLELGQERRFSDNGSSDYSRSTVSANFTFGKPVLGTRLSLFASAGRKTYAQNAWQEDLTRSAALQIEPLDLQIYGFVPTISIGHSKTDSDFDWDDTEKTSVSLGFRSAF